MFTSDNNTEPQFAGLETKPFIHDEIEVGSKFDITMYVRKQADDIYLNLVYKTSLFRRDRMEELLAQYIQLLQQLVDHLDRPIAELSLVTSQAQNILPDPTVSLSDAWQEAIHTQFAQMAQKQPHRPAVVDFQETWTYQELDKQSNQLAHYLITQGIQPGNVVAIYGHRSASLVLAWLGILKAGAAFCKFGSGLSGRASRPLFICIQLQRFNSA